MFCSKKKFLSMSKFFRLEIPQVNDSQKKVEFEKIYFSNLNFYKSPQAREAFQEQWGLEFQVFLFADFRDFWIHEIAHFSAKKSVNMSWINCQLTSACPKVSLGARARIPRFLRIQKQLILQSEEFLQRPKSDRTKQFFYFGIFDLSKKTFAYEFEKYLDFEV